MKHKIITHTAAGAAVRAAAKRHGIGLTVKVPRKYQEVEVSRMYRWDAERAGLNELEGRLSTWLRANVPADVLATGFIKAEVNNSMIEVDYFSTSMVKVLPTLESSIESGLINGTWAKDVLKDKGLGYGSNGMTYDRGSYAWTEAELDDLGATENQKLGLAIYTCADTTESMSRSEFVNRFEALTHSALELFFTMFLNWSQSLDELLMTVETLAGTTYTEQETLEVQDEPDFDLLAFRQETPATEDDLPQSVREYLGRLIHEPKKRYALQVALAYASYQEPPVETAPWAASVVVKVKRYMGR